MESEQKPADWCLILCRVVGGKIAPIRIRQDDGAVIEGNKISSFLGATDDAYHAAAQALWDNFKEDARAGRIEGVEK